MLSLLGKVFQGYGYTFLHVIFALGTELLSLMGKAPLRAYLNIWWSHCAQVLI